MFNLAFHICDTEGFLRIVYFIKLAMNILRFVIPIILIIMLTIDLVKNTITPNNKDGMKKITNRLIAAVVVFLIPSLIDIFVGITSYFFENSDNFQNKTDYKLSNCYTNANLKCINNINSYLMCEDVSDDDVKDCRKFRQCNDYSLTNSCQITVEFNNQNCSSINFDKDGNPNYKYIKFAQNNYGVSINK